MRSTLVILGTLVVAVLLVFGACVPEGPAPAPSPTPQDLRDQLQGRIIFATISHDEQQRHYGVNIIKSNGTGLRRLLDINNMQAFTLSPNESKMTFIFEDYICVLNIETGEVNTLTLVTRGESDDTYIAWSPSGTQIAYVSDRDLWVINADGSGAKRIVKHTEGDYIPVGRVADQIRNPTWSADEKRILFDDFTAPSSMEIRYLLELGTGAGLVRYRNVYVYDVNSGAKRVLRQAIIVSSTPDRTKVLLKTWESTKDTYQYVIMSDDGSNQKEWGELGFASRLTSIKWAPDNSLVTCRYLLGMPPHPFQITVLDATTGIETEVPLKDPAYSLVWSPDSQYIAYSYSSEDIPVDFLRPDVIPEIRVIKRDFRQPFTLYSTTEKVRIYVVAWLK